MTTTTTTAVKKQQKLYCNHYCFSAYNEMVLVSTSPRIQHCRRHKMNWCLQKPSW